MIKLDSGGGGTFLIIDTDTKESRLVQTDWDFPGVASSFGWSHVCPDGVYHGQTDGTVDCPVCGKTATEMISEARQYLDDHIDDVVDDPGYFCR